jgi:uncharacterized protein (TIGR02147 family)
MQIFRYSDEIEVLQKFLNDNSSIKSIKSKIAEAAGCQLSYFSQVMAGKVHLTPDHGFGIAKFLLLNEIETEYFLILIQLKRSASKEHRNYLQGKIAEIRKSNFNLDSKIKSKDQISEIELQRYYGDWRMQAIHMYLTIPKFQRLLPLAAKLKTSEFEIRMLLDSLVKMGLAKKTHDIWTPILKDLHVPIRSPHSIATQFQWKMRSLQNLQEHDGTGVHYVGTFSLSSDDFEKLKGMVIEFIANTRSLAQASPEEQVAHLGLSYFQL